MQGRLPPSGNMRSHLHMLTIEHLLTTFYTAQVIFLLRHSFLYYCCLKPLSIRETLESHSFTFSYILHCPFSSQVIVSNKANSTYAYCNRKNDTRDSFSNRKESIRSINAGIFKQNKRVSLQQMSISCSINTGTTLPSHNEGSSSQQCSIN